MTDKKRTLIFDIMRQMSRSKTVALNVVLVGLIAAYLKFKGINLTAEEMELAAGAVTVLFGLLNIAMRFITKTALMEKKTLRE